MYPRACGLCAARARVLVLEYNTMVRIGQRFETVKFSKTSISYQAYDTAFQYQYITTCTVVKNQDDFLIVTISG